jgi:hypothetical protein
MKKKLVKQDCGIVTQYESVLVELTELIETAKRSAAQSVNSIMTAAYWLIGRRIVAVEQKGKNRAGYGETIINQLACDLISRFGKGFAKSNLYQMRAYFPDSVWKIADSVCGNTSVYGVKANPIAPDVMKMLTKNNPGLHKIPA